MARGAMEERVMDKSETDGERDEQLNAETTTQSTGERWLAALIELIECKWVRVRVATRGRRTQ